MSGRKPIGAVAMEKVRVCLPPEMVDYLEERGDGNISAGVRAVVDECRGLQSTAKPKTKYVVGHPPKLKKLEFAAWLERYCEKENIHVPLVPPAHLKTLYRKYLEG